jgi:hypothetical protein
MLGFDSEWDTQVIHFIGSGDNRSDFVWSQFVVAAAASLLNRLSSIPDRALGVPSSFQSMSELQNKYTVAKLSSQRPGKTEQIQWPVKLYIQIAQNMGKH